MPCDTPYLSFKAVSSARLSISLVLSEKRFAMVPTNIIATSNGSQRLGVKPNVLNCFGKSVSGLVFTLSIGHSFHQRSLAEWTYPLGKGSNLRPDSIRPVVTTDIFIKFHKIFAKHFRDSPLSTATCHFHLKRRSCATT